MFKIKNSQFFLYRLLTNKEKYGIMAHKELNDRQKIFLEVYFQALEDGMSSTKAGSYARKEAGYAETTHPSDVFDQLPVQAVADKIRGRLLKLAPQLPKKLEDVLDSPSKNGSKTLLDVTFGILDRIGVGKKEQVELEVKVPDGIVLLPPKKGE